MAGSSLTLSWHQLAQIQAVGVLLKRENAVVEQNLTQDLEYLANCVTALHSLILHSTSPFVPSRQPASSPLQLAEFSSLVYLELKRVPLDLIRGLDKLKNHLVALKVWRCEVTAADLLSGNGLIDTRRPDQPWPCLTGLALAHNGLRQLGPELSLTPRLHTLDASHNRLEEVELDHLPHLHSLFLSYNALTTVPSISCEATLTTLLLAYNRLDHLTGLELLSSLETLDIQGNCLMHHDAFAPVSTLSRLRKLDTRYNPLCALPAHRQATAAWLHGDILTAATTGTGQQHFLLDGLGLGRSEFAQVGTSRLLVSPPGGGGEDSLPLHSASCQGSREGSVVSLGPGYSGGENRRSSRKKKKGREAVISDFAGDDSAPETEKSHLLDGEQEEARQAARQLELLRQKYGEENWLREKAGESLHQILGLEARPRLESTKVSSGLVRESSLPRSPTATAATVPESAVSSPAGGATGDKPRPPRLLLKNLTPSPAEKKTSEDLANSPAIEAEDVRGRRETRRSSRPQTKSTTDEPSDLQSSFYSMYSGQKEPSPSLPAEDQRAACRLSVERQIPGDDSGGGGVAAILTVDKEFIREQAPGANGAGITRVKWFLHSLESCDMLQHSEDGQVTVHLCFNTVRRDRRERTYRMAEASYGRLMAATSAQLEQTSAGALSGLTSLQCVKCQSIFSQELAEEGRRRKKSLEICCINCGSNMVIECGATATGPQGSQHVEEEAEGISLGIPVCEALDLEAIEEPGHQATIIERPAASSSASLQEPVPESSVPERSFLPSTSKERKNSGRNLSVQADIHNHVVLSAESNLPDVLPKQALREGSKNSRSPSVQRSESSSDISVISDCSIEVLARPPPTDTLQEDDGSGREDTGSSIGAASGGSSPPVQGKAVAGSSKNADVRGVDSSGEAVGTTGCAEDTTNKVMLASDNSTSTLQDSTSSSVINSDHSAATHYVLARSSEAGGGRQATITNSGRSSEDESLYQSCTSRDEDINPGGASLEDDGEDEESRPYSLCSTPQAGRSRSATPLVLDGAASRTLSTSTPLPGSRPPPTYPENQAVSKSLETESPSEVDSSLIQDATVTPAGNVASGHEEGVAEDGELCEGQAEDAGREEEVSSFSSGESSHSTVSGGSLMNWNYTDFSVADHRIQLYCELSLFHEEQENLLIIAKGDIFVKSSNFQSGGVLVLSNRKLYLIKAIKPETEEPSDWLELHLAVPILRMERLVLLLGSQGFAIEVVGGPEVKSPSSAYFPRLGPFTAGGVSPVEGADSYQLLLRDADRTELLVDQIVDTLQERVRGNPIPVVRDLGQEEEERLLAGQLAELLQPGHKILTFQSASNAEGCRLSVVTTPSHVVVTEDFFTWRLQHLATTSSLTLLSSLPISTILTLDIYQSSPNRIAFSTHSLHMHLIFQTEKGVQAFVRGVRSAWEKAHSLALEDIISFHLTGSKKVLKMTALMEESVSFQGFDLSQWIKVTTCSGPP